MIKKVLLLILVIILGYGVFSSWAHGVNFDHFGFKFSNSSYAKLIESQQTLSKKKQELEKINTTEYNNAKALQDSRKKAFEKQKAEYDELARSASVEEIRQANQDVVYMLDYLWMKIGTYANNSDIKVLIEPDYDKDFIHFDVTGPYIGVINFIYDLEIDEDLGFNIDNLVMQAGDKTATKANFIVGNVKVQTEQVDSDF